VPIPFGDSVVVLIDGSLRLIDPPRRCKGYANCCICSDCKARAKRAEKPQVLRHCSCEPPRADGGVCGKCGYPIQLKAAA
jgi:hypothetical protein